MLENHLNKESVIRYYLLFLPPKGTKSILDIGCGRSAPYSGMLKKRCERYKGLDIRSGSKVDIIADITDLSAIKETFEWGWCAEVIEHIEPDKKEQAIKEILKVCQNCVFTYPSKDFVMKDKDDKIINSFFHDAGHSEVLIDWNQFSENYNIVDKSTKNGRKIIILKRKDYKEPDKKSNRISGYFNGK